MRFWRSRNNRLSPHLNRPILNSELRNSLEINQVASEDCHVTRQRDRGDAEVHRANANALLPQFVEFIRRGIVKLQNLRDREIGENLVESKITANYSFRAARLGNVRSPAEDLLVERYYRDMEVVLCEPGHPLRQRRVMRIGNPLQNPEMVSIKNLHRDSTRNPKGEEGSQIANHVLWADRILAIGLANLLPEP